MDPERTEIHSKLPPEAIREIKSVCQRFERQWLAGEKPSIVSLLGNPKDPAYSDLLEELLSTEIRLRFQGEETFDEYGYREQFPDHAEIVSRVFAQSSLAARGLDATIEQTLSATGGMPRRKPGSAPVPEIPGYELEEEIGQGGMGTVWLARHAALKRRVAIKMPLPSQSDHERFLREARASADLRHPNICPIYDVAEIDDRPYLVMAYIDGETLKHWARREKPSPRQSAEIISTLSKAVDYAHQHEIVHRDLKPSNVMIDRESSKPVLMDFGLAKNANEEDIQLTLSGQIIGTPAYMSPEQAAGLGDEVGPAADVYSLGTMLYELLSGRPPFVGRAGEVIHRVQSEPPTPLGKLVPKLHRDLETICLKSMEKKPQSRYASAEAMADDLDRFCNGEAISARREGALPKLLRFTRRHGKIAAAFLFVAVLATASVIYFARGTREARETSKLSELFNRGLQSKQWNREHLKQMDTLIEQLSSLETNIEGNVKAKAKRRKQLDETLISHIRENLIAQASIEENEIPQIENTIGLLVSRRPQQVDILNSELQARLRNWQSIFRLAAPATDLSKLVTGSPQRFEVRDDRIYAIAPAGSNELLPFMTRTVCQGNIRLIAEFDKSWTSCSRLRLTLNANYLSGYQMQVRTVRRMKKGDDQNQEDLSFTFANCWTARGNCMVEIFRDGTLLQQIRIPALKIVAGGKPLRLVAMRTGNRLSFQVGTQSPLTFDDIFPLGTTVPRYYAFDLPADVGLVSLEAQRQALPVSASQLEKGDELFANGDYSAALVHYRDIATGNTEASIRDLSRYKSAVCHLKLKQSKQATELLEQLLSCEDENVRILASCRYWLFLLQQKRYDDSEVIYQNISSKYQFDQLAASIPYEQRRAIIRQFHGLSGGLHLLQMREEHLKYLERAVAVEELLSTNVFSNKMKNWSLIRGYHALGRNQRALAIARDQIAQLTIFDQSTFYQHLDEYCWLLRQEGLYEQAETTIQRYIHLRTRYPAVNQLLVERARVYIAQQRWDEARQDIETFLASTDSDHDYRIYSNAILIQGFLLLREGKEEEAKQAWHKGRHAEWKKNTAVDNLAVSSGMGMMNAIVLASLCEQLSVEELTRIFDSSGLAGSNSFFGVVAKQQANVIAPAISQMASHPSAREHLQRYAFQQQSLYRQIRTPFFLLALQVTRNGAAENSQWSEQQEKIVLGFFEDTLELFRLEKLSHIQLVQFLATWKGTTGFLGWGGLSSSLSPEIRAPAAYLFGFRYLKRKQPKEATSFFQQALVDAPADSPLAKLAAAELKKLSVKK